MLGPQGSFGYTGIGSITDNSITHPITHIAMVAAGSGITPMLSIVKGVMQANVFDSTKLSLINCNRSQAHVIAKTSLAPLHNMFPSRFQWLNILSEGSEGTEDEDVKPCIVGRLTREMLVEHLPPVSENVFVLHCGTPSFDEFVGLELRKLGYPLIHQF
ncbi:Aste57867_15775 [Aphanomyces stellatus]|uniref:Aste57867_15775 protein n=1 Tax=Aphanomyces stellatus TaxID=120398 RepID=A0A485L6V1_9STRA|nr:hypothetical protein As57867_015719 [Aphanomyces stellatus]VFT92563.1 Aste57867_15775 [Aphanomyces stellatus]